MAAGREVETEAVRGTETEAAARLLAAVVTAVAVATEGGRCTRERCPSLQRESCGRTCRSGPRPHCTSPQSARGPGGTGGRRTLAGCSGTGHQPVRSHRTRREGLFMGVRRRRVSGVGRDRLCMALWVDACRFGVAELGVTTAAAFDDVGNPAGRALVAGDAARRARIVLCTAPRCLIVVPHHDIRESLRIVTASALLEPCHCEAVAFAALATLDAHVLLCLDVVAEAPSHRQLVA